MADTTQQLPISPWLTSNLEAPSSKNFGSLEISEGRFQIAEITNPYHLKLIHFILVI